MKSHLETAREIIAEQIGIDEEDIDADSLIVRDLGADSLDTVELVMAFEEHYVIDIPKEEAVKFQKVGDIVAYLERIGVQAPHAPDADTPPAPCPIVDAPSLLTDKERSVITCAYCDLKGAEEAKDAGDTHQHDWKAHALTISEMREVFPFVVQVVTPEPKP